MFKSGGILLSSILAFTTLSLISNNNVRIQAGGEVTHPEIVSVAPTPTVTLQPTYHSTTYPTPSVQLMRPTGFYRLQMSSHNNVIALIVPAPSADDPYILSKDTGLLTLPVGYPPPGTMQDTLLVGYNSAFSNQGPYGVVSMDDGLVLLDAQNRQKIFNVTFVGTFNQQEFKMVNMAIGERNGLMFIVLCPPPSVNTGYCEYPRTVIYSRIYPFPQ
ncbi:hypothetical protein HGB07_08315 [Candidatus Roizmanbacteria bacterium]|nr:hypothetical protein [Candidatus Roizmanbacteria bacterium]